MSYQVIGGDRRAFASNHCHQRTLTPSRVGNGDDGRLEHSGMGHDFVLQFHRRDPLPTGLDDVLGAVADLHKALLVQPTDIAGTEPTVVEALGARLPVVRAGDPRAPNLEFSNRFAVTE